MFPLTTNWSGNRPIGTVFGKIRKNSASHRAAWTSMPQSTVLTPSHLGFFFGGGDLKHIVKESYPPSDIS